MKQEAELAILQKVQTMGKPLGEWDVTINCGILTGFNEAFYLSTEQKDALIAQDCRDYCADVKGKADYALSAACANMSKYMPFCYDESGIYTNQKAFIATANRVETLKYLTEMLNSHFYFYLWSFYWVSPC